ncbi:MULTISPECIES: TetR/AcrR family transcriptional regulator [unclassified Mycobacterium]|uniref:TetR/AcrR family transcriptional regulator n=1 Tax=unclassified Mycobacterium TaxID=2642494 RepID=UPI0029C83168|nr:MULTISPECIES: TetR family transcriptional regulator [unclassified Mycobacterium]
MTATRRKPNVEERRRALCDAAIELLAEDGARNLTHLRVDRRAGVADGTTSFYYQTRAALLRATTDRVVSQDLADFTAAMAYATSADADNSEVLLAQLAVQAMRTGFEPERSRARARFELMMIAARDPELGSVFDDLMKQFLTIGEQAVTQVQPAGVPLDQQLIKEQALAVITFLGGFLFRLANGLSGPETAEQLESYLYAVIAGVAAEHDRIRAAK